VTSLDDAVSVTDAIRDSGLRATQSRRAVIDALRDHPHSRADEVYKIVAETIPQTNLQSVYNALTDFVRVGLVRRIEPAGHPGLFELRVNDNHHHLICTRCGAIEDVDCTIGYAPCLTPSDDFGFALHSAEVTFWGLCPECAQAEPA